VSLLAALRAGTRGAHDRLEDGLDVLTRCRTTAAYTALLQDLRSVHAPLEAALARAAATPSVVPDWQRRRKTGWLDEDLAALGAAAAPDRTAPGVDTAEDVAGVCYVLEGATLGGAVVVRELLRGTTDPPPHRFFASYGADRGAMWSSFRRAVSAAPLDPERTVDAARRTFDAFERACGTGGAR
jgi:heme oxygenase